MDAHRTKVGIEGTWQAYFDLFKQALNDGDQGVKVVQLQRQKIQPSKEFDEAGSMVAAIHTQSTHQSFS